MRKETAEGSLSHTNFKKKKGKKNEKEGKQMPANNHMPTEVNREKKEKYERRREMDESLLV